jgi:hypothetical protein
VRCRWGGAKKEKVRRSMHQGHEQSRAIRSSGEGRRPRPMKILANTK